MDMICTTQVAFVKSLLTKGHKVQTVTAEGRLLVIVFDENDDLVVFYGHNRMGKVLPSGEVKYALSSPGSWQEYIEEFWSNRLPNILPSLLDVVTQA